MAATPEPTATAFFALSRAAILSSRTLTVGSREGSFPGMLAERQFTIVLVDPSHPKAYDPDCPGEVVDYKGNKVEIKL